MSPFSRVGKSQITGVESGDGSKRVGKSQRMAGPPHLICGPAYRFCGSSSDGSFIGCIGRLTGGGRMPIRIIQEM